MEEGCSFEVWGRVGGLVFQVGIGVVYGEASEKVGRFLASLSGLR